MDGVLDHFDRTVGLDKLAVIHLNDSKNPRGASKDRHAPVGAGWIGYEAMRNVVTHDKLRHLPMILETPWVGKDEKSERPMYEAEIALLAGRLEERFGGSFLEDVEKIAFYTEKEAIHHRSFVLNTWELLKNDAKAKKEDSREPMERMYDWIMEKRLFSDMTEEQINHRLLVWLAGNEALKQA